ncbi:MAG TPA: hypothetical protein VGK19_05120 [Capsulimonadaceae bacterium]|jgi:hypothetical protein
MMRCSNCNAEVFNNKTVCPNCGNNVPTATPTPFTDDLPAITNSQRLPDREAYFAGVWLAIFTVILASIVTMATGAWPLFFAGPISALLLSFRQRASSPDNARGLIMGLVYCFGGVATLYLGALALCRVAALYLVMLAQ